MGFSSWDIGGCNCGCPLAVQVRGFNALGIGGLTVEIRSGGSTIYSGTTNSSGVFAFTGAAGTYDVRVTDNRTPARWVTQTFTSQNLVCNATVLVNMSSVNSGFHGSALCGDALKDTLYATDVNGTWTLAYDGSNVNGAGWYVCASKAGMASVVTNLNAGVCTKITGTANTPYLICLPGSTGTAAVVNFWGMYAAPGQQQTSATPTCSSGSLNLGATIPASCFGSITQATATATPSVTCPTALSITATMPATGTSSTANPGAGSITITE